MKYYLFENHMGGVYFTSDAEYEPEECEQCGETDWKMGEFYNVEELEELMSEYDESYVQEVVKEFIGEFI